jgi:MFS family permease
MSSRQRWTLTLVCTAVFMLLLDITVVSVALPSIQRDLRASLPDLQWVSAAYALVLAVVLLPAAYELIAYGARTMAGSLRAAPINTCGSTSPPFREHLHRLTHAGQDTAGGRP